MLRKKWNKFIILCVTALMVFSLFSPTPAMASGEAPGAEGAEGYVTVSVEKLTLGQGYIVEPVRVPFEEGDTVADIVTELLGEGQYRHTGSAENSFYLSQVYDPGAGAANIPLYIIDAIGGAAHVGARAEADWLGEFDYWFQAGWMYAVNNAFPNVGASDAFVADGDVIRWQFTVYGLGADLGASVEGEPGLIQAANKDALTAQVAAINSSINKADILSDAAVLLAYNHAYDALTNIQSSQSVVLDAYADLQAALDARDVGAAEVNKALLTAAIAEAQLHIDGVTVSVDGSDVSVADLWVTAAELDALIDAIESAEQLAADADATQPEVNAQVLALIGAREAFHTAKKQGLLEESAEPQFQSTFTVAPKTVTLELYDTDGQKVDIGDGAAATYNVYNASLPAGEYSYRGFDPDGNSIGGGKLTVAATEGLQQFELRQLNFAASNAGWQADTDYSVRVGQNSLGDTSLVLGQKTSAGQYPLLALTGNTYFYSLEPSEARKDQNYIALSSSVTVTIAGSAQLVRGAIPLAREITFTVPEAATLYVGRKIKHFVSFQEVEPLQTASADGKTVHTFKLMDAQDYNYRVSQAGKLTNAGMFKANAANAAMQITEQQLDILPPTAILNRGTYLEGNIYLNINTQNHLKLEGPGDDFHLLPLRSWQALIEGINNYFFEPDVHYEIVAGHDVIDISAGEPGSYSTVHALKNGTAIVKVTYDALKVNGSSYITGANDAFSAIWPENAGLFVVTVGQPESGIMTGIESNKERNRQVNEGKTGNNVMNLQNGAFDADIDSVYFVDTEPGAVFTFTPSAGSEVSVLRPVIDHAAGTASYGDGAFTAEHVTAHADGSFSVLLTEGRNIVKIERNGLAEYQVMTARPLQVTVTNVTRPGEAAGAGDTVQVVFNGLSFPANKLSGIYNFNAQLRFAAGPERQQVDGDIKQYNITTQANRLEVRIPDSLEGSYTLRDGHIRLGFFGSPIGDHRNINPLVGANPNFTSLTRESSYSIFPEIVLVAAEPEIVDTANLLDAIGQAEALLEAVVVSADGADVHPSVYWVTEAVYSEYVQLIGSAHDLIAGGHAGQDEVDAKVLALNQAQSAFQEALQAGTKDNAANVTEQLNTHLAYLVQSVPSPGFGTGGGEWTILPLARANYDVPAGYMQTYYNDVVAEVQRLMPAASGKPEGRLDRNRGTEHSRLILALTAIGKNMYDVAGYDISAALADLDYVTRQGINGPIFALLALDSYRYDMPVDAHAGHQATRDNMIGFILDSEVAGGGWSLSGAADPDITAMALQALAPYYESNELVKAAADRAVSWLSAAQNGSGGYASWGEENVQSVAQVVVALTSLGINPHTDERFVKNGYSAVDNLLSYAVETGGFVHPKGGGVDAMATDQGTYALVAFDRYQQGKTSLYDMTDVVMEEESPTETVPLPEQEGQPVVIPDDGKSYTIQVEAADQNKQVSITLPEHTQAKTFIQLPADVELPHLAVARGAAVVEFPAGIRMSGSGSAALELLTAKNRDDAALHTKLVGLISSDKQLDNVHEFFTMGGDQPISFTNGFVMFTFEGMKGKDVAFIQNGVVSPIQKFADDAAGLASGKDEYAYEVGDDLIFKTNHFTDFAVYSTKLNDSGGGGGGGGGGGPNPPTSTVELSVDKLTIGKGYVLSPTVVAFTAGETVWDVFQRELGQRSIAYEYSFSSKYGSVYVESIAGDGEFDHGSGSGWMYSVNGVFPNYGASQYVLKQGDQVAWRYTTNLGVDIGQDPSEWEENPGAGKEEPDSVITVDSSATHPLIEIPDDSSVAHVVAISEEARHAEKITIRIPDKAIVVWLDLTAVKQAIPFIEVVKGSKVLVIEQGTALTSEHSKIKLFAQVDDAQRKLSGVMNKQLADGRTAVVAEAFEMGDPAKATQFDESVTLRLQGMGGGGRQAGIVDHNGKWTAIPPGAAAEDGAVYAEVEGDDLIITTSHFSTFIIYTIVEKEETAQQLVLEERFADADHIAPWAYDWIADAVERGFVEGYDGRLNPKKDITRAEFATLVVKVFGIAAGGEAYFGDVQQADWFYATVNAAYAAGIVAGYDGQFLPDHTITRAEMAAMIARALKLQPAGATAAYEDEADIAPWARGDVQSVSAADIMVGYAGRFQPKAATTREMAFVVVMRAYQYNSGSAEHE